MKLFLDWSNYQNAGMGDAYADIPLLMVFPVNNKSAMVDLESRITLLKFFIPPLLLTK